MVFKETADHADVTDGVPQVRSPRRPDDSLLAVANFSIRKQDYPEAAAFSWVVGPLLGILSQM